MEVVIVKVVVVAVVVWSSGHPRGGGGGGRRVVPPPVSLPARHAMDRTRDRMRLLFLREKLLARGETRNAAG